MFWIALIIGITIGTTLGVVFMCLLFISKGEK